MTRVGLIGLGAMGGPMGRRMLDGGLTLGVHDRDPDAVAALVAAGARAAQTPATLALDVDVVITSLPDADALAHVVLGAGGLTTAPRDPGAGRLAICDTSTISPEAARDLSAACARRGVDFLDAPVSGGPLGAGEGTLAVMVGGDAEVLDRVRPALAPLAGEVLHCGPAGAGQVCKAVNQLVVMGTIELVAEALVLAQSAGLDAGLVRRALLGGYAGSRVLEVHGARMVQRDFQPGGRARFNAKDIATLDALAIDHGLSLPAYDAAARQMRRLLDAGGGDLDNAALITVVEARA